MPKVARSELELALEWASSGYGNVAYISRSTGQIYWDSEDGATDLDDELPDDIDDSNRYLTVPSKQELNLGARLAVDFVRSALPSCVEEVQQMFRRKGAFARFKALLDHHGLLEQWHEHEASMEQESLRQWCDKNGLELQSDQP